MRRRIEPGWRYTLAQLVLRLLFGRQHHFISPWFMAGVGAGVVIFYQDKVLLHQRRGHLEQSGKWGTNGGYLNLDARETFKAGLAREIFEETGLRINPKSFGEPLWIEINYNQEKIEMANHTGIACWYAVEAPKDILPLVQNTEEAHNFRWASEEDILKMAQENQLSSPETIEAFRQGFIAKKTSQLPVLELIS